MDQFVYQKVSCNFERRLKVVLFEGRVCFPPTRGLYSKARWEKHSELPFFMLLPSSLFALL